MKSFSMLISMAFLKLAISFRMSLVSIAPEFIISYLGILKSACVAHIIPPNISSNNLYEQISTTNPVSIITSKELFSKLSVIDIPTIEKIEYSEIKSNLIEERKANESDYAYLIYTSGTFKS